MWHHGITRSGRGAYLPLHIIRLKKKEGPLFFVKLKDQISQKMVQDFLKFLYNFLYYFPLVPLQILLSVFLVRFTTCCYKNPEKKSKYLCIRGAFFNGLEATILFLPLLPFVLFCVFIKKFAFYLNLHKELQEIVFFLLLVLVLSLIGFVAFIEKQDARSRQEKKKEQIEKNH